MSLSGGEDTDNGGLAELPFVSVQEWSKRHHEPAPWVIEGFAREGDVVLIGAPPKSGKTFLLSALFTSGGLGVDALGGFFRISKPLNPLLIERETADGEMKGRMSRLARGVGHKLCECGGHILGREDIIEQFEDGLPLLRNTDGSWVANPAYFERLERAAKSFGSRLIIDDTLSEGNPAEENRENFRTIFNAGRRVAQSAGGVYIVIHHGTKASMSSRSFKGDTAFADFFRGSGHATGATDVNLIMRADSSVRNEHLRVWIRAQTRGLGEIPPQSFTFQWGDDGQAISVTHDGPVANSTSKLRSAEAKKEGALLKILQDSVEPLSMRALEKRVAEEKEKDEDYPLPRRRGTLKTILEDLLVQGLVRTIGTGRSMTWTDSPLPRAEPMADEDNDELF